MSRYAVLLAGLVVLGCASPQQRQNAFMAQARDECLAFGYKVGDPEFAGCVRDRYSQLSAANAQAGQRSVESIGKGRIGGTNCTSSRDIYGNVQTRCY